MVNLVSSVLVSLGILSSPAPATRDFQVLGETDAFTIEIDVNSVHGQNKYGGPDVYTTMKRTMFEPVDVKGRTKKGAYYVEETLVSCSEDTFTIVDTTLYTKDDERLAYGKINKVHQNPKIKDNFISVMIAITCNSFRRAEKPVLT